MTDILFPPIQSDIPCIDGLSYIPDFISHDEEQALIKIIDAQPWLTDFKRRVQHYGYKYDYKARAVTNNAYLGSLPDWIEPVAQKLPFKPDQAIVNEYESGQGISAHIDCVPCFGDVVASLTLGSGATMQFKQPKTNRKEELYLQKRSLIVLSSSARYEWTHAIPSRKSDMVDGFKVLRERRVSCTFRKVMS